MLRRHAGALVLLTVMSALLLASMRNESFTTDEPLHLTRGLAWFWGTDTGLSYAHPPLGNALAAAPIALFAKPIEMGKLAGYRQHNVERVAHAWLRPGYEHGRSWLMAARASVALMTLLLGIQLYVFCLRIWDRRVAFWALFFFCLHPTLIAHGRLVTTDMPVTVAMCGALLALVLYLRGGSHWQLALCALLSGAAMASKYTALSLLPIFGVLTLGSALMRKGRYGELTRFKASTRALAALTVIGLSGLLVVNAAYRFEHTGHTVRELCALKEPENSITRGYRGRLLERESVLPRLPRGLVVPLPHTFVVGLTSVFVHARDGHATTFMGEFESQGSAAYFPVLVAVKTPALLLLVLLVGLWRSVRRKRWPSLPLVLLASFAAMLMVLAMRTSINIGVRHVMPVMPVMAILGGLALSRELERLPSQARSTSPTLSARSRALMAGALALHLFGMTWAFPDYVSDFNALVLGRMGGQRISIVGEEWGQDIVRLGEQARARGIRSLRYNSDGFTAGLELARFGVRAAGLGCPKKRGPQGYVAVSARDLARDRRGCYAFTRSRKLLFHISEHVFVYAPAEASIHASRGEP